MKEKLKTIVRIISAPVEVTYECPYCGEEIQRQYKDFVQEQAGSYPGDWHYETCPDCDSEFFIDELDWD